MQPQSTSLLRDVDSLFEHVQELEKIIRRRVEFGNPGHPVDPADVTLAGSLPALHNGSPDNMMGSWVEIEVDTMDAPFICYHNLGVVPIAGQVNVRWFVAGFFHDGTGANAASTISVNYETGDAVTANSIELRMYAGGTRSMAENPIKVTLFFIPAVRG